MTNRLAKLTLVAVIAILALAACGSDSDDVPSLRSIEDTQEDEPATGTMDADTADSIRDDEAAMMAFTECLRDQGIDVLDAVVDADGNVGKPEFAEGVDHKGKDMGAAWEACAEHLEGVNFGKKSVDVNDQVDQLDGFLAIATCLRDKGYDVDDPTAETLDRWLGDFKDVFDWKDPAAIADYEECAGDTGIGGGTK